MNAQRVKLNIIPGGVPPIVHVSQYDKGRNLEFVLYDGTTVANIESGTVIDIRGTKPDNMGFSYPCTYSNNIVSVTTEMQMTAVAGSFDCELHLSKAEQEIGTANFILEVEPSALSKDTLISASDIPAIIEAARNNQLTDVAIQNAINSATAAANSATRAASSESVATQKAQDAADSASAASASASAAATSATNAESASAEASGHDRAAFGHKQSAEAAANAAIQSANEAAASAQRALENATGATVFSGSDAGLVPPNTKGTGAILHGDGNWYSYTSADVVNIYYANGNATFVTLLSNAKTAIPKDTYLWVYETANKGRMFLCKTTKNIAKGEQFGLTNEPTGGNNLKFVALLDEIENMKTSFRDGVDTIYNACRDNFPSAEAPQQSTPTAIAASITSVMSSVFLENSRICTESPFSVTFYLPVLRLKAIVFEIDSDDIVYLNDKRVQPGVMYEDFSVGNTHMCKITINPNPNVAYTGGLDIKYATYYEMNAINYPYTDSWTEDNPY